MTTEQRIAKVREQTRMIDEMLAAISSLEDQRVATAVELTHDQYWEALTEFDGYVTEPIGMSPDENCSCGGYFSHRSDCPPETRAHYDALADAKANG